MDLFSTTQDKKGRWSEPEPLGNTICSESNEGSVAFDKKFKTMYFTRCVDNGGSNLACDIYYAPVVGNGHGASQPLILLTEMRMIQLRLVIQLFLLMEISWYLHLILQEVHGGKDLWYSKFDKNQILGVLLINLGPSINSPGDDMFPTFRKDGSLYFSSNGRAGG